jgi:hypothetical protein
MLQPFDLDQAGIVLIPDLLQLFQRAEAQCLVEGSGFGVAGVGVGWAERLDLQVFDAQPAGMPGTAAQRPPDPRVRPPA